MRIKQLLYEQDHIDSFIKELENKIEFQEYNKYEAGMSANTDGMPSAKGKVSDPIYLNTVNIEEIEEEIEKLKSEIQRQRDQKARIAEKVNALPERQRVIIGLRYFGKRHPWHKIARGLGISIRQCQRMHREALKGLSE